MKKLTNFLIPLIGIFTILFSVQLHAMNLVKGAAHRFSASSNIATIFISAPSVADYQIIDSRNFIVYAKSVGSAQVSAYDDKGKTLLVRSITVNEDYRPVTSLVKTQYPQAQVKLQYFQDHLVISGNVASEDEKDGIYMLAGELLGLSLEKETLRFQDASGNQFGMNLMHMDRRTYRGLVNRMRVSVTKQVNVKMTTAEVSRTYLEELGVDIGTYLDGTLSSGYFLDELHHFSSSDIATVIQANGTDSNSQVLAQPNLTVLSGESAKFLLGGEYPYTIKDSDGISVEFKEWGIGLSLAAKVVTDSQIRLTVAPEVSYIQENKYNTEYPTIETRRVQTTIELGDGQSFVLAGLLKEEDYESLSKIPYIGDIPILGALFRHSSTKREQTELVIVATVNLVQPLQENMIQLPSMQRTSSLSRFFNLPTPKRTLSSKKLKDILASGGFKQ